MASTSMLARKGLFASARAAFASTTCTCSTSNGAVNFKGKNRAHLHSSSRTLEEQQEARPVSPDTPVQIGLEDISQIDVSAGPLADIDVISEAVEEPISREMLDVFERRRRMLLMNELESIGSSQTRANTWQPHHSFSRSKTPASVTLSHLVAATAHIGHSKSLHHPMAFPYIYGTRHGVSVIDMRETLTALRRAAALVRTTVENDGIVLFVGGKSIKGSERVLDANARKMGRNGYATSKWLPGTLTNASTLFGSSRNMITDTDVNPTSYKPSLIVLFAPLQTPFALREANATNVPTIALCDSNVDPRHFTYPIPSNDDSLRVVELISGVLAEAGKEGIKKREHKEKQVQSTTNLIEQEYEAQQRSLYKSKQRRLR